MGDVARSARVCLSLLVPVVERLDPPSKDGLVLLS